MSKFDLDFQDTETAFADKTTSELKEAKNLISSLKGDIEGYRQQIELLKGENLQLTNEKAIVTEERNKAQLNFDSARNVIPKILLQLG